MMDVDRDEEIKDACLQAAKRWGDGPWLEVAAADKGWQWVLRALGEPAEMESDRERTIGTRVDSDAAHVTCGEYNPDGDPHGYAIRIYLCGQGWYCGEWVRGRPHGTGVREFPDGGRYEGQWQQGSGHGQGTRTWPRAAARHEGEWAQGKPHGQGTFFTHRGRYRTIGRWANGQLQGRATTTDCPCFDLEPDLAKQIAHHDRSPSLCKPFGYMRHADYDDEGGLHGTSSLIYCNGDIYEQRFEKGRETGNVRFVMSPHCPEERFRGFTIEGVKWDHPSITRADGSLTYTLSHPDPMTAPDEFRTYRDYFERGFLPVEDRDRKDISDLLARAAERLLPPLV